MKQKYHILCTLVLSVLLVACATPGTPAEATATITPEPTETAGPPTEEPADPTATVAPPPTETLVPPTPQTPVATIDPNEPWSAANPLHLLLGPAPGPEGWQVQPCEGEAALLCVSDEQESIGAAELLFTALDTHPDFQAILAENGLEPGATPQPGDAYESAIRAALTALAEQYFDVIEADRQATYPNDTFVRLEPEPIQVGQLPGLTFGFRREDSSGAVAERYLNYAAYDQGVIYWLGAQYDPANVTTFVSNEVLTEFEPYLREIVAGLKLPPPVIETDVTAVNVLTAGVPLTAVYGQGVFGVGVPVDASQDEPYSVTGASPDGRWWRVACSEVLSGICWLPADPARVQPVAP